jgi:hypothetical protein
MTFSVYVYDIQCAAWFDKVEVYKHTIFKINTIIWNVIPAPKTCSDNCDIIIPILWELISADTAH